MLHQVLDVAADAESLSREHPTSAQALSAIALAIDAAQRLHATAADKRFAETKRPIAGYNWSRDAKYILYVKDNDGDENFNVYAVDPAAPAASGSEAPTSRDLTGLKGVRVLVYSVPKNDADIVYIGLNDRGSATARVDDRVPTFDESVQELSREPMGLSNAAGLQRALDAFASTYVVPVVLYTEALQCPIQPFRSWRGDVD